MDITINRKNFIDAFSVGASMAGKSKVMPILDTAKVIVKGTTCTVTSYDGEVAVTKRFSLDKSEGDINFCINPKDLLNILKAVKDIALSISICDNAITIRHNKGEAVIPVSDPEDFPKPNVEQGGSEYTIPSESLHNMLNEARNFRSTDTLRPIMMGVQLYINNGCFGVFASDSRILYNNEEDYEYSGNKISVVVPPNAIDAILNILDRTETARMIIQERNAQFRVDDAAVVTRVIEGRYPDAKSVIPNSSKIEVSVSKSEIWESVKRISLTCGPNALVKLSVDGMNMGISSEDIDFSRKSNDNIMCQSNGNITIGFNYANIMEAISHLGQNIRILLNDPTRASLWKDTDNEKKIILVMPMMLQE